MSFILLIIIEISVLFIQDLFILQTPHFHQSLELKRSRAQSLLKQTLRSERLIGQLNRIVFSTSNDC